MEGKKDEQKKPNIIVFVAEQWRGDAVGCAGNSIVKTPNLDKMKDEGMYFTQCYTTNPICSPSRCSLATISPHQGTQVTGISCEGI